MLCCFDSRKLLRFSRSPTARHAMSHTITLDNLQGGRFHAKLVDHFSSEPHIHLIGVFNLPSPPKPFTLLHEQQNISRRSAYRRITVMGKKKYLFQVYLELVELFNVALRNEYIFVKIRQKNGGKLNYLSSKAELRDHKVVWNEKISFQCKTQANASTGILNECYLRFSVRKETRLGRTHKLGFVDINLSEFAGCGKQSGKYLLDGYNSLTRLDNSILKFFIDMQLISGDPLFKRHTSTTEEALRHSLTSLKTPFVDENKLTDSTRVNNDVAVNEIIEQNLRYTPSDHKGLSLHDIQ